MLVKKLVERPARSTDDAEGVPATTEQEYLRITSIGAYYLKRLVANFTYVDAMTGDTLITRPAYHDRIRNVYPVVDRLARAEFFRQYLDDVWATLIPTGVAFDWPDLSGRLRDDIASIQRRQLPQR